VTRKFSRFRGPEPSFPDRINSATAALLKPQEINQETNIEN
jgi:hypothetical protein